MTQVPPPLLRPAPSPARPDLRLRLAVAAAVGIVSALYVYGSASYVGATIRDIDSVWLGARLLLAGENPYAWIGPGLRHPTDFTLQYPLSAVLLLVPLAPLPLIVARAVFVGASVALLAFALTRDGYVRLWACASGSFLMAVWSAQWTPLLTAAVLLPPLGVVFAAKPNLGLALFAARPRRAAAIAAVALAAASLLVDPHWPASWLASVRTSGHIRAPLASPFGLVLPLALLRWRRPEARLLFAMACVRQNAAIYELLPLFLVPCSRREFLVLAILSHVVLIAQMGHFFNYDRNIPIALVYLPALAMVLRRPNEGDVPAWADRLAARLAFDKGGSAAGKVPAELPRRRTTRESDRAV